MSYINACCVWHTLEIQLLLGLLHKQKCILALKSSSDWLNGSMHDMTCIVTVLCCSYGQSLIINYQMAYVV